MLLLADDPPTLFWCWRSSGAVRSMLLGWNVETWRVYTKVEREAAIIARVLCRASRGSITRGA